MIFDTRPLDISLIGLLWVALAVVAVVVGYLLAERWLDRDPWL